jgi:hypothetical protein
MRTIVGQVSKVYLHMLIPTDRRGTDEMVIALRIDLTSSQFNFEILVTLADVRSTTLQH